MALTDKFPWRAFLIALAVFLASLIFLPRVYACLSVAYIIAYLVEPVVDWLTHRKVPRELAAALTVIVILLVFVVAGILVIPKIIDQAHELIVRLPSAYQNLVTVLTPYSVKLLGYDVFSNFTQALNEIGSPTDFMKPLGGMMGSVFSTTYKVISTVLGFFIVPLLSFYLLKEFPVLWKKFFLQIIPKRHHEIADEIRERMNNVLGGFIRGQLVVSSILSLYYAVALSISGLDLAIVLGVMAGFFNIVPYLGIFTVFALSLIVAFLHGATFALIIGVSSIFIVGIVLEGAVITPKVLGRQMGLSPLALILALLIGSELFGVIGMLIAVPVAAMVKVIGELVIEHRI